MNYRRGFQRLYAVLTVAWIGAVLFTVLSGHWQPWRRTLPRWVLENEPPPTPPATKDPVSTLTPDQFMHDEAMHYLAIRISIWLAALCGVLPTVLYFVLFYVAPWIYRGFRHQPQNA